MRFIFLQVTQLVTLILLASPAMAGSSSTTLPQFSSNPDACSQTETNLQNPASAFDPTMVGQSCPMPTSSDPLRLGGLGGNTVPGRSQEADTTGAQEE